MLHAIVTAADIQDRDGGAMLLATLFGMFPFLLKLYADGGYQGPEFQKALKRVLSEAETEIVKRSDRAKGFVVLPRRWVVERTLAWLNRCRRLAKDWENLNLKARAFLLLASIRLMVRRICRARNVSGQTLNTSNVATSRAKRETEARRRGAVRHGPASRLSLLLQQTYAMLPIMQLDRTCPGTTPRPKLRLRK